MRFRDRVDAGQQLATALAGLAGQRPIVLALPRGGVPVAAEVARALKAPLGLLIVRKIGLPMQPELAMGAVVDANGPLVVRNPEVIRMSGVSESEFSRVEQQELREARRRWERYGRYASQADLRDRVVIVVDDGIATGASMRAALAALRQLAPHRIVVAVPVAAASTVSELSAEADEVVALDAPGDLGAIGAYYSDFDQVSDEEVVRILKAAQQAAPKGGPAGTA